jgi:hypothetical protein
VSDDVSPSAPDTAVSRATAAKSTGKDIVSSKDVGESGYGHVHHCRSTVPDARDGVVTNGRHLENGTVRPLDVKVGAPTVPKDGVSVGEEIVL